nr:MAG TPA: hypothetical protein [Caudoviricetes sp.]
MLPQTDEERLTSMMPPADDTPLDVGPLLPIRLPGVSA